MATLLDAPKPPNPAKVEEFVEKQLGAARRRVRVLDFFMTGLVLGLLSLIFFLAVQLVDRYKQTPPGTGWAVVIAYLALTGGFLYLTLFRPSRRQINPYFAARQVEQTVPNAKNSLVTWVDFEQDTRLPGSIRSAIGQKAARDLKGVDLNRAIENRKIICLTIAAAVFLLANVIVAFLPPTRTELTLEEPRKGDITVFNNQDVAFSVRVHGRVPGTNDPDAVRLRLWYNPDDPETYEDRPMHVSEGDRRVFNLIVPAKQVRNGFRYKVLAGNTQTDEYTVTCKIIPEFTGFEVNYEYLAYLKRPPEKTNDANLLAPYGTTVTLIVSTNREVKHGHIEIEGNPRTIDGQLIDGRPDAIVFTLTLEKEGAFRIWFTTPEGDKNQDPARFKLQVIDPKPVIRNFDLEYEYPAYLRFKPMTVVDVREPQIEALRGTKVVVTAKTTRGVKDAKLEIDGRPAIAGEPVPDQPTWTRFKLEPLDKDATARVTFTPSTAEGPSAPRSIPIHALVDQAPAVELLDPKEDKPQKDEIELPANGTLDLRGLATDDHGVDKLTLRMKVIGAEDRDLVARPYRGGMSFLRKEDNSWPTRVEYKEFVKLPDLRMEHDPKWRVYPSAVIEYWLEAMDNCAIPPGPNKGVSKPKRIKVIAPNVEPKEKRQIDQRNEKLDQDQRKHEEKQDRTNKTEKRDVNQPPPKGAENQDKSDTPQPGGPQDMNPMGPGDMNQTPGMGEKDPTATQPEGMTGHDEQTRQVQNAINDSEKENRPGDVKPTSGPPPEAKVNPGETRPAPKEGPMGGPPPAEDRTPKTDPNKDMTDEGGAGAPRPGNVDKTKEEKGGAKDEGANSGDGTPPEKGKDWPWRQGEAPGKDSSAKPERKDAPMPKAAPTDPPKPEKGEARKGPPDKVDSKDPKAGERTSPGAARPDNDVTRSATKPPSSEPNGATGDKPPSDVAGSKPQEREPQGGTRPPPKKNDTASTGGARNPPPEDDGAGGAPRPSQPSGMNEDQARGGAKPGPGSPPQSSEQGELEREQGELEREINSTNPKIDPNKQATADRLTRNHDTRDKMRQKFDEMERNAGNDELKKNKVRDMRAAAEKAAKDYDNERPTSENVQKTAQKLGSSDRKERRDAENRIKDWEKDQQTKNEVKNQTDELKKRDRAAGEKVEDAMNKAEQARNQSGNTGESPKVDEKQLQEMAKNLNGSDEKAKGDAQKQLGSMAKDPKSAKETQEKLQKIADKAPEGSQERKDLQHAADQAGKMAKDLAQKSPEPKGGQKIDPKDLEKAAKALNSADEKTRDQARRDFEKMMNDPKTAKDAQDQLREMADKAPEGSQEKKDLQNAADQAGKIAKDLAQKTPEPKGGQKIDPKDLETAAKALASADEKTKDQARRDFEKMMQDPKAAKDAQEKLQEMAKNAKSDEDKQALENAAKHAGQLAKEMNDKAEPKLDPQQLKDLAKQMANADPKAKADAAKKMQELMKDPKAREKAMKMMEEMAKNAKNSPEDQKALEDAMKQAAEMARNEPPKMDPKDLEELAKQFKDLDPKAKDELKRQLDEAMKDPKRREEIKKKAEEIAKNTTPEQRKQFDEMMRELGGPDYQHDSKPDPADPRNKLKAAELLLEQFKNDPALRNRLNWTAEQEAEWLKNQEAAVDALKKQVEKGEWQVDRSRRSAVEGGPDRPTLEPKSGNDGIRGGRYAPPSGYVDPYKKLTTGGGKAAEPKK